MARLLRLIIAIICILLGAAIGALNPEPVVLDLGLATLHVSLGLSVLVALLMGVILGGAIIVLSVVVPLRRRLRRSAAADKANDG